MTTEDDLELVIAGATDMGPRTNNEDAFLVANAEIGAKIDVSKPATFDVRTSPALLAVSDGMGGEKAGEIASEVTLETLRVALAEELARLPAEDALRRAIERANDAVFEAAKEPGRDGMGATLVAALVLADVALFAVVGDARGYVLRSGDLAQVTKDQSFLQQLLDSGAITPEQIPNVKHKNIVLQAIGKNEVLEFPIVPVSLRRDDVILLCSDGLSGPVEKDDARDLLMVTARLDAACARLIATANKQGGTDNVTVVLGAVRGARAKVTARGDSVVPVAPGKGA